MKRSAGGVCLREKGGLLEVLMVKSSKGRWIFPKGGVKEGETAFEAALRETLEESGWEGTKGSMSPLGQISKEDEIIDLFWISDLRRKSDGEPDREPTWLPLSEARLLIRQEQPAEQGKSMSAAINVLLTRMGLLGGIYAWNE